VVEALAGKKVVILSHRVRTEAEEVFTFGSGSFGKLGHGKGTDSSWPHPGNEHVPRLLTLFRLPA